MTLLNTGRKWVACIALACMTCLLPCRPVVAAEGAKPLAIRVAIYADAGGQEDGSPGVQKCLPESQGFVIKAVTAEQIRGGELNDFDVLIHTGGSGERQATVLGEKGRERERRFVADGGGFIGICAGAYLASAEYPWSLGLLDAQVVDNEHWARGTGEVQLRIRPAGRSVLGLEQDVVAIRYGNGPLLAPANKKDIEDYELLAVFDSEIAKNGAPTGVMKGTGAIARGPFGKGRVVCFSPHPEKTPGLDSFVRAAVRWAAGAK